MAVSSSVIREFIRKVYRAAAVANQTNSEYLDGLADAALAAMNSGKGISSSSGNGISVSYEFFYGWRPEDLLDTISRARTPCGEATVDLALALVESIRHVSTDFQRICK